MKELHEATWERVQARLAAHPMYGAVRDPRSLRTFLEHHVICVLDFMSLLKTLQAGLTCVRVPWTPAPSAPLARLINEIVLDEESDAAFGAEARSHYEWYVAAMEEAGADAGPIRALAERLAAGDDPTRALAQSALPTAAREFGATTFRLCEKPLPVVAAVFLRGREDLIPRMFAPLVRELERSGLRCGLLLRYLERHIEVDSEDHGPRAERLMAPLFAGRDDLRRRADAAVSEALLARERLWDAVLAECGEPAGVRG
ncbi:MAG: DUF3050 domain-containing protein [Planctomycetota bacterium]